MARRWYNDTMNTTQILDRAEIKLVLQDLHQRQRRSKHAWLRLAVFRLSCCCGLRASELCAVELRHFLWGTKPCLVLPKGIVKGGKKLTRASKGRLVPLWWDAGTAEDLAAWYAHRLEEEHGDLTAPFLTRQRVSLRLQELDRFAAGRAWRRALGCLGPVRQRQVPIHGGRRSFASHALFAGRSLVEVKEALGHGNIKTTSIYLGLLERDGIGDVFA